MSQLIDHLEKLEYFQAVAEAGSFHQASRVAGISQSALSHSIKALEEALDVELFSRSVKGASLTLEGKELLELTESLFQQVSHFEADLRTTSEMRPTLRIGTYDAISAFYLPGLLRKAEKKLELRWTLNIERSNQVLIEALREDRLDIAFLAEPTLVSGLKSKRLFSESYQFFVSPEHPVLRRCSPASVSITILQETPLLLFPQAIAGLNLTVDQILFGKKSYRVLKTTMNSFESMKSLAVEGLGIACLPSRVAAKEVQRKGLRAIRIESLPQSFGKHWVSACWKSSKQKALRSFLQLL